MLGTPPRAGGDGEEKTMNIYKKSFLYGGVILIGAVSLMPFIGLFGAANSTVSYLEQKPLSPWSIMALSSAGETPSLDSLKTVAGEKAIDLEAPILALTASGKDPRVFGSENLITRLKTFYDGTQLGEATILNDDIFGLLALIASGEPTGDTMVDGVRQFIVSKQNSDGGFGFAVGGGSATNPPAAAIMALRASGMASADAVITKALAYLRSAQNDDGGFPYDPKSEWGTSSDASSDAWVMMALSAVGEDTANWQKNGQTPGAHLGTLKQEGGFYLYQIGGAEDTFTPVTTSYALLALSGKTLPTRIITPDTSHQEEQDGKVSFSFRIEGKSALLCAGDGRGVFAIEAVSQAETQCGISHHIVSSSLGEYVDEIADEKASGSSGWMYTVNGTVASVGAGAYRLAEGDSVLWYFGSLGDTPKNTAVPLSVTIPAPQGGGNGGGGGGNGAEGETPPDSSVSLTVEIGQSGAVNPLSFGALTRGAVSEKKVSVRNSGEATVTLGTSISGDAVFRRYLRVNEGDWKRFRVLLSAKEATTTALSLSVPVDYEGSGAKTGTLIFWATPTAR